HFRLFHFLNPDRLATAYTGRSPVRYRRNYSSLWRQIDAEQLFAGDVMQSDGHRFGLAVDLDRAEELEAVFRRAVRFQFFRNSDEFRLRAECVVHLAGAESSCVQWPGDEFPERVEVSELRFGRVVIMRRAVMHIGRDPYDVFDPVPFDEPQQIGEFKL